MGILDNTHLKYFTLASLKRIVNSAGYTIEHVDYSTNDYPKEIQKKLLAKAGLQPTDAYWKMVDKKDARASQYKLVLKQGVDKAAKIHYEKMPEKPEQFRDTILNERKDQVEELRRHANEQAKIIEHYKNENEDLARQLSAAKSPITHRLKNYAKKLRR
jgi:uncharacterized protein (UPF0261 family)